MTEAEYDYDIEIPVTMKAQFEIEEAGEIAAVGTTGPCMMSASARKRFGVEVGDVVMIEPDRGGGHVHRTVHMIPQQLLEAYKDGKDDMQFKLRDMIWMNLGDFRLLGVDTPGLPCQEPVKCTVTKSDEQDDTEEDWRR